LTTQKDTEEDYAREKRKTNGRGKIKREKHGELQIGKKRTPRGEKKLQRKKSIRKCLDMYSAYSRGKGMI